MRNHFVACVCVFVMGAFDRCRSIKCTVCALQVCMEDGIRMFTAISCAYASVDEVKQWLVMTEAARRGGAITN